MRATSRITATVGVLASSLLALWVEPVPSPSLPGLGSPAPLATYSTPVTPAAISPQAHLARRSQCQTAIDAAARVGWPADELNALETLLWRESRCTTRAVNDNDNGTTDRGATQINDVNVAYLTDIGVIAHHRELFDLHTNLTAALALRHRDNGLCAWSPPAYCD